MTPEATATDIPEPEETPEDLPPDDVPISDAPVDSLSAPMSDPISDSLGSISGNSGTSSGNGTDGRSSTSTFNCKGKFTAILTLPRSYANVSAVRVVVGKRVHITRIARRKVRVTMTRKHGDINIAVSKKGHPTVKRTYVLCAS